MAWVTLSLEENKEKEKLGFCFKAFFSLFSWGLFLMEICSLLKEIKESQDDK